MSSGDVRVEAHRVSGEVATGEKSLSTGRGSGQLSESFQPAQCGESS